VYISIFQGQPTPSSREISPNAVLGIFCQT